MNKWGREELLEASIRSGGVKSIINHRDADIGGVSEYMENL